MSNSNMVCPQCGGFKFMKVSTHEYRCIACRFLYDDQINYAPQEEVAPEVAMAQDIPQENNGNVG